MQPPSECSRSQLGSTLHVINASSVIHATGLKMEVCVIGLKVMQMRDFFLIFHII